jgi:superfamily II DNA/RNA helicase
LAQQERLKALNDFTDGKIDVLISTNLASRGLDVDDLDNVINLEVPNVQHDDQDAIDTYIHRIGRTGRISEGTSVTYFDPAHDIDQLFAPLLIEYLESNGKEVPEMVRAAANGDTNYRPEGYVEPTFNDEKPDESIGDLGEPEF